MQVHNIKYVGENAFHESAHPSSEGSLDTFDIMKALYMIPIMTGIFVPTTAEIFGGEDGHPGYGLYDRALGITYLLGLWEALEKTSN